MAHKTARTLVGIVFLGVFLGALSGNVRAAERVVYLGGGLSSQELLTLTTTVAASAQPGTILIDSARTSRYNKTFLARFHPGRVVPVGAFAGGTSDLEQRLDVPLAPALAWKHGRPEDLWRLLFHHPAHVVVCPAEPRPLLLEAACLAGVLRAPLFVVTGDVKDGAELRHWLTHWHTRTVYAAGSASDVCKLLHDVDVIALPEAKEVAAVHLRHLVRQGPVETFVVTNPADLEEGRGGMSTLAPWIALQRHAPLLCTGPDGDDVESVVGSALRDAHLKRTENLLLVGNLKAIPMERRANPIPTDKDAYIEMEPFTPHDAAEPFTFATGRLFHEDFAAVALMLARQRLVSEGPPLKRALVVSNAGGGLPLLETFSRNTAKELRNAGLDTTARFGKGLTAEELRKLLPENDLFLWEGHHNTLIRDWAFPDWDEPLPPSFVFLQSCLALHEWKAQPLLQRGAFGVVGSSTRIYSASGGACSLAYFDALLYDRRSLGGSLRQAKNFLVAYAQLKEKRLGKDAHRTGANLRSAWAFSLWGDPTFQPPLPDAPADAMAPIHHEVHGSTLVLSLPPALYDKVSTTRFQVQLWPNGRLAGLCRKDDDDDEGQPLVPFVFAEVSLPKAHPGQTPRLQSKLPASRYVFTWDARRRCGYLIATPRGKDRDELRFHIDWVPTVRAVRKDRAESVGALLPPR